MVIRIAAVVESAKERTWRGLNLSIKSSTSVHQSNHNTTAKKAKNDFR
jgi:hypothetical protein